MRRALVTTCSTLLVVAALSTAASRPAQATEVGYGRKFGLGVVFGNPTGLSGKAWISNTNAIDFAVGFYGYGWARYCEAGRPCDRAGYSTVSLNADYLWQSNIVKGTAQLDWHIGAGGRAIFWGDEWGGDVAIGARAPIGLDLMFSNPSWLEVFFELVPALYVLPGPGFNLEGGLGVRAYF